MKREIKVNKGKIDDSVYLKTGVPGFDKLMGNGIPKGHTVLVSGGAGSGKTIFCLQTAFYQASRGKKCLYISFEENESRLLSHMRKFGWDCDKYIKEGTLKLIKSSSIDLAKRIEDMVNQMSKSKFLKNGDILDLKKIIIPQGFDPDLIIMDSLSSISSAFNNSTFSYRLYVEQLFDLFSKMNATSIFTTETEQSLSKYSRSGIEEFLADSVIVLYYVRNGSVKERASEILKVRGERHEEKIVAMQITESGIVAYPEQEVFGNIKTD